MIIHTKQRTKINNIRLAVLAFLLIGTSSLSVSLVSGQSAVEINELGFMGIYYNDSVKLRWAPITYEVFKSAVEEGFTLERGIFAIDGETQSQDSFEASIIVLANEIKLIDEEDWGGVAADSELKDATVELLYNFSYTPLHVDSVNIFSASEEVNNKHTLVSFASILADRDWDVATSIGWAYVDDDLEADFKYAYILTLLATGEKYYTMVSTESEYELKDLPKPSAITGDSIVRITFYKKGFEDYYGYLIQRSSNNGQSYEVVTDAPAFYEDERQPNFFHFVDSLPSNDGIYVYRIAGVTPFGLQGDWSDTIKVHGVPGPVDASPEITAIVPSGAGVDIAFVFPEELESKIQGFEVIRSLERTGPFLNITESFLSPTTREFYDPEPLHSNFYFIRAIDENGYPLLSIPTYYAPSDSIAAAVPNNLQGTIDNDSKAHVSWSKNSEFDVKGYKVYASNAEEGLFVEITPGTISDTFFTHQLANVLNEDWFIKVRSVDLNENESELSEAVQVMRPDLIAPSAPVLKDLNTFSFGIAMNWVLSSSLDVETHLLQRKEVASNNWSTILDITNDFQGKISSTGWNQGVSSGKPPEYNFIDSTATPRVAYHYRLIALDEVDNIASSAILEGIGYDSGVRGEIYDLMAIDKPYTILTTNSYTPDKDKAGIAIGWNYTDTIGVHHFIVYRSADGWPYKAYQSYLVYEGRPNPATTTDDAVMSAVASGLNTRYVVMDKNVQPGKTYKYKVVAKHLDGGFSETSEVVSVTTSN